LAALRPFRWRWSLVVRRSVSNYFLSSRFQDRKQHRLGFLQDVVIADSKHLKSLLPAKESLSLRVFLPPVVMTSAIDLDHEADLVAEEIDDVGTERLLAAEFQSGETPPTQAVPQHPLQDRRISAQAPCVFGVRRDRALV